MNESEIFSAALKLSAAERGKFLDLACKGNPELRRQIEALVKAHFDSATFLHDSGGKAADRRIAETVSQPGPTETPGVVIAGRYKLLEPIGEGGMGSVWLAEQAAPVKRKVAIKLIKAGMDSKSVLARFDAERQALALMDHPNIAKVYDGGVTEQGRPYFVMEYVKGIPLTEYCDQARLSLAERLKLFASVCQAVQHAHQKGIIHRDLKPSNILACLYDGKPVPKVIDFGLAKAMHQPLTDQSLHTAHGMMVGTPLYMSPEQAEHNNLDVDTRTDIYSLGVILYELLTGSTPLEKMQMKAAAFNEILRLIKEVEPPKPSTRLSGSDGLPSIAAQRNIDPRQLQKSLTGDLDWIVMKALDKERSRRYDTANGLARDIDRYLSNEAVEACPPSTTYRLGKFLKRNKVPAIAAILVLLSLLFAISGTSFAWYRATSSAKSERLARMEAWKQMLIAKKAEEIAAIANQQAQTRLSQIEKSNAVLVSVFKDLNPHEVREGTEPLEAVLASRLTMAARELEGESVGDPLVVSNLQNQLGISLLSLGFPDDAIPLFLKVRETRTSKLGADHPETLDSIGNLGVGYLEAGKFEFAAKMLEETLNCRLAIQNAQHPDVLVCKENLGAAWIGTGRFDLAIPQLEETLTVRKRLFGKDNPETLNCMSIMAEGYRQAGKFELAISINDESFKLRKEKLGANHVSTLTSMNNLALSILESGDIESALPLLEESLRLTTEKLGANHPQTFTSMNNLAMGYKAAGQIELAVPLFEQTLLLRKAGIGESHPNSLASMHNLAEAYSYAGMLDLALPLYKNTLELLNADVGVDHPDTLTCMSSLASAYQAGGKPDLALPLYEETLRLRRIRLGSDHFATMKSMDNLANAYQAKELPDLAIPLLVEVFERSKASFGADNSTTLSRMNNLAFGYWKAKQFDKSIPICEESLKLHQVSFGPNHPNTLLVSADLGVNYKDAGRISEALPLLEDAWLASKEHPSLNKVGSQLVNCYFRLGRTTEAALLAAKLASNSMSRPNPVTRKQAGTLAFKGSRLLQQQAYADAEPLLREALAFRKKLQPEDWITFDSQSQLGEALLGLKKHAEAEPMLLAGYEGLKKRETDIPPLANSRIPDAIKRLVKLYSSWNVADPGKSLNTKAAEWQTKLDEFKSAATADIPPPADNAKQP